MAGEVALMVAIATVAGWGGRPALLVWGGDPAPGILVNASVGARPFDAADPMRPTVVFIHGLNPAPKVVHFSIAERLADMLARRGGPALNVLSWNWNAATFASVNPRVNIEAAVNQGRALAFALRASGVDLSRTQLIGQSSGAIVATSAARCLASEFGTPVAQLTLLDPASHYHGAVFERLAAGSAAPVVENFWAPGPSGYGKPVEFAGVRNTRVDGPSPYLGTVWPLRSSHYFVVHWYIDTAGVPSNPSGFNTSALLRPVPSETPVQSIATAPKRPPPGERGSPPPRISERIGEPATRSER